jgi:hypothetical protein
MRVFYIGAGIMRYIFIITISLILASCGPSSEEKKNIASVTCSIMSETRNMDAAVRVREMNDAREKIGGEPFLQGDSVIQEAFEYGLCQELVLSENYEEMIRKADSKPSVTETFHLNGKLKSRTNYQSINDGGERHGIQESYYENGQLDSKLNFKDGKIDGLGESYYENGQLYNKVNYKDGKEDGLRESYYENGQLWFIKNFKDGELHGLSETYFEDGSKYDDACYKNGELTDKSYCKPQ